MRCAACPGQQRQEATITPLVARQDIIVGQSTVALELLDELAGKELDAVLVPVGGGGLVSGIAAALRHASPSTAVTGCQPANNACMAHICRTGRMPAASEFDKGPTLADGTAGSVEEGALTISLCRCLVDRWVLVPEARIAEGMRLAESLYGAVRGPPRALPGPSLTPSIDGTIAACGGCCGLRHWRPPRGLGMAGGEAGCRHVRGRCAQAASYVAYLSLTRLRAACAAAMYPTLRGPVPACPSDSV